MFFLQKKEPYFTKKVVQRFFSLFVNFVGEFILEDNIGLLHIDSQSNYYNTCVFYKELKTLIKKLNISKIDLNN